MRRPTVRLTLACDNACVFCAQRGLTQADLSLAQVQSALEGVRAQSDEVTFIGGEPATFPGLTAAVAAARALGFRSIGVQTNGRLLGTVDLLPALADAGLTDIHVSLHGASPAVHDFHVGVPGGFTAILSAMAVARVRGLKIAATTVLTRSNFRVLSDLPRLLHSAGVSGWLVTIPRVAGAVAPATDTVSPRLALAIPFALQAMDAAIRMKLPAWIQGAPLCLLGPFAARALPEEAPRAFGAACERCAVRGACPGVDAAYLARFRGDELKARAEAPPLSDDPITRLFVGVGELAPSVVPPVRELSLPLVSLTTPPDQGAV